MNIWIVFLIGFEGSEVVGFRESGSDNNEDEGCCLRLYKVNVVIILVEGGGRRLFCLKCD